MLMGWATSYWNIIKKHYRMRFFNSFSWKNNFLSLLRNIRIQRHFPLISLARYFFQVTIYVKSREINIYNRKKRSIISKKFCCWIEIRGHLYISRKGEALKWTLDGSSSNWYPCWWLTIQNCSLKSMSQKTLNKFQW